MSKRHDNSDDSDNEMNLKPKKTLNWYFDHMKKINDQKKQKKFLKPKSNDDKERIKKKERELEEYLNRLTEEDRIWEQYQSDNVFNIDFVDDEYFSVHDITTVDISKYLIDGYIKYINWAQLFSINDFMKKYNKASLYCNEKSMYIDLIGTYNGYIIDSNPDTIDFKNEFDMSAQTELQITVNEDTIIRGYYTDPKNTQKVDFNEYDILQLGYKLTIKENCTLEIQCTLEILNTVTINGTLHCVQTFLLSNEEK